MYSTKELENNNAEYIFWNGKFSEDEQGEIWIQFSAVICGGIWTLREQRTQSISVTFIDSNQKQFLNNFKNMIITAKNNYI